MANVDKILLTMRREIKKHEKQIVISIIFLHLPRFILLLTTNNNIKRTDGEVIKQTF